MFILHLSQSTQLYELAIEFWTATARCARLINIDTLFGSESFIMGASPHTPRPAALYWRTESSGS